MKYSCSLLLSFVALSSYAQNKLEATGNAGIGTTSPTEKLEIYSAGLSNIKLTHPSDVLGVVGALKFNMAGSNLGKLEVERTDSSGRMSAMKFFVRGSGGEFEAMRIANNGFVGIGETSPSARLHVDGSPGTVFARFTQTDVSAADGALSFMNGTGSAGNYIPVINGRGYIPGRSLGLYLIADVEDVLPASDIAYGGIILDSRSKTGAKLTTSNVLAVNSAGVNLMLVKANGSVAIGTADTKGYKLAVNGSGIFTRVVVKSYANWPDFVFHADYKLPTLSEVEQFVVKNQHLPGIPSASEIEKDGVDVGEMNKQLLQKVEEQMLYIIEMNKQLATLSKEVEVLKQKIATK
ncbi:hypothetical protein [Chitinophaga sp. ARDCPP14]|uniref:hypothetical protein n=1 Tax=Chitinophaga sp. ARDCPP14 TaxID=3391139 RepID=UPI003F522F1C